MLCDNAVSKIEPYLANIRWPPESVALVARLLWLASEYGQGNPMGAIMVPEDKVTPGVCLALARRLKLREYCDYPVGGVQGLWHLLDHSSDDPLVDKLLRYLRENRNIPPCRSRKKKG